MIAVIYTYGNKVDLGCIQLDSNSDDDGDGVSVSYVHLGSKELAYLYY